MFHCLGYVLTVFEGIIVVLLISSPRVLGGVRNSTIEGRFNLFWGVLVVSKEEAEHSSAQHRVLGRWDEKGTIARVRFDRIERSMAKLSNPTQLGMSKLLYSIWVDGAAITTHSTYLIDG